MPCDREWKDAESDFTVPWPRDHFFGIKVCRNLFPERNTGAPTVVSRMKLSEPRRKIERAMRSCSPQISGRHPPISDPLEGDELIWTATTVFVRWGNRHDEVDLSSRPHPIDFLSPDDSSITHPPFPNSSKPSTPSGMRISALDKIGRA